MSRTECRLSEFELIEKNRNFVTERLVNKDQREQTINCLEQKYRCGQLPKYSAHYVDKFVPVEVDCPCLRGCTIVDLIRDYNDHLLGLKNSRQFRLTGGL